MEDVKKVQPDNNRGGEWVRFGGEEYKVPPLGFRAIQELQERILLLSSMGTLPTPEQFGVIIDVVWEALKRNYPALTREAVVDMLDVGNFQAVINAALSVSGFVKGDAGNVLTSQ